MTTRFFEPDHDHPEWKAGYAAREQGIRQCPHVEENEDWVQWAFGWVAADTKLGGPPRGH